MDSVAKQIAALRLFNEKTSELLELSFIQALQQKDAGVTIGGTLQEDGTYKTNSERRGPSQEAIKAFVLTFRFFIQDNETTSLNNISKIYSDSKIDQVLQARFESARTAVNNMLDSPNFHNMSYNKDTPTNKEVMHVYIYGTYAHANPKKSKKYKEWMSYPLFAVLIDHCFTNILAYVLNAIIFASRINEEAIQQLGGGS